MKLILSFVALLILSAQCADVCTTTQPICNSNADCRSKTNCNSTCVNSVCVTGTLSCPFACDIQSAAGRCVSCVSDADCTNSSFPFCDTGSKTCAPCLTTDDTPCLRATSCAPRGCVATTGVSGTCANAVNCSATMGIFSTCIQSKGTYSCSGECSTDSQCAVLYPNNASKRACTGRTCTQCSDDSHCVTSSSVCGTCSGAGQCVSYSNCTGGAPKCSAGVCGECATGAECEILTGNPRAACSSNGTHNTCQECQSSADCHFQNACDAVCNLTTKRCDKSNATQNCVTQGKTCLNLNPGGTPKWGCYECATSNDCLDPTKSVCSPEGTCVQCHGTTAGQCASSCGSCVNNTCVAGNCSTATSNACVCLDPALPVCSLGTTTCVECNFFSQTASTYCKSKLNDCAATCSFGNRCVAGNLTCSNSTPYCDTANSRCRACTVDSHCTNASKPYCNGGTCSECANDANCYRNADCSRSCTGGVCVSGARACNCANNTVADICLSSGVCGPCTDDSQCTSSPNLKCANGRGIVNLRNVCVQCTSNTDCRSITNCNAMCSPTGQCYNSGTPLNCSTLGQSATCSGGTCLECTSSSNCPASRPTCSGGFCRCQSNAECRSNTACDAVCGNDGVCISGSLSCPAGKVCRKDIGSCSECFGDSDCTVAGKRVCGGDGTCVACTGNQDCRSDAMCNAECVGNTCVDRGLNCGTKSCLTSVGKCVECLADSDCDATKPWCVTAGTSSGVCMECRPTVRFNGAFTPNNADCRSATDCNASCVLLPEGGKCVAGGLNCATNPGLTKCLSTQATCVNCVQNSDCPSNNCLNYRCAECANSTQCNSASKCGSTCSQGSCTAVGVACPTGKFCRLVAGTYSCVECLTSADCGGNSCSSTGRCGFCSSTADCIKDSTCSGALCVDQVCDFTNAQACSGATPKCLAPTRFTSARCVQCLADAQCPGTTPFCVNSVCAACRNGGQCGTTTATTTATGASTTSAALGLCSSALFVLMFLFTQALQA